MSEYRPRIAVLTGGLMSGMQPPLEKIEEVADVVMIHDANELAAELPSAEILFVWDYRFAALDDILPTAQRLKWIHAASVGVEPLLTSQLLNSDVTLTNSRGVFDRAIAEYVAAGYLSFLKRLPETIRNSSERKWEHRITKQMAGSSALVVGTGSIGKEIARLLSLLGVDVTLAGRRRAEDDEFGSIESVDNLSALVPTKDLVVLAAPLTAQSRHMVNKQVLDSMGSDTYLINIGRGGLIDEEALVAALSSGQLAGALLDVFTVEPLPEDSPLWRDERVIVSPHMSADFDGFDEALISVFRGNLDRWIAGNELDGVVDKKLGYVPSTK